MQQAIYGPYGEHFDISEYRFPRMDGDGVCWMPEGWAPEFEGAEWDSYADSMS